MRQTLPETRQKQTYRQTDKQTKWIYIEPEIYQDVMIKAADDWEGDRQHHEKRGIQIAYMIYKEREGNTEIYEINRIIYSFATSPSNPLLNRGKFSCLEK